MTGFKWQKIFKSGELEEASVTEDSSATASDGKSYRMKFYNLDAVISVGKHNQRVIGNYGRL
ncbi:MULTISPECIES: hypothetical protein [unclassified Treponema]|uniref:hypothetical protein n=1 Tax=unclassified Treponema TaxID=2638727 RepID=UPI0020A39824|nr:MULTISPECIES: hypothetical protein [unclassified Treponema]